MSGCDIAARFNLWQQVCPESLRLATVFGGLSRRENENNGVLNKKNKARLNPKSAGLCL
jgi:hypothetical protein